MSAVDNVSGLKVGDVVWVGAEGDATRKVTHKILSLWTAADEVAYATLTSGQTGRMSTVPVERLTRFRLLEGAAA